MESTVYGASAPVMQVQSDSAFKKNVVGQVRFSLGIKSFTMLRFSGKGTAFAFLCPIK
jgi:hypothetical protein